MLLLPSSLMAFPNSHSTAFSVFTDCSFFVIIWIAPLFGILLDVAIHIIPDSGVVLLSRHQINAGFCLVFQSSKHIFDVGS